jgi:hypothetical protein
MLRPEIQRTVPFWTLLGAASGAGLGFIIANIPGALMGGYAGNRLGAIRDAKGKSVLEVRTPSNASFYVLITSSRCSIPLLLTRRLRF